HPASGHHRSGKSAVIDGAAAAGGAAFLQKSQLRAGLPGPPEGQLRSFFKLSGHICPGPGDDLVPYPLCRVVGNGESYHALGADRHQLIAFPKSLGERVVVIAAAVLAVAAQETGGDEELLLHRASSFPSSTARTSLSP